MMISAQAITDVMTVLKSDDFYRPAHGTIFEVIIDVFSGGAEVDAVMVASELEKRGVLQRIGGAPYLLELIQDVPSASNATYYARIVSDKATMRRLVQFGIRCQQLGYTDTTDTEDVDAAVAQAESFLRQVRTPAEESASFSDMFLEWKTWIGTDAARDVIPTPWFKVNEILGGGLHKGRLYVFAGRPGQGKSISVLNVAAHAAEQGKSVMIISLEMPRTEVTSRLLSSGAQVSFQQVIRRQMRQETQEGIEMYAATNNDMSLYCVDRANLTVEQIVARCRAVKNLDMVVVDYAQLVKATDRREKRNLQVAHVSQTLKVLAKEMDVAVALAAQSNRQGTDPKTGKARRPTLTDLGESASLEADADAVIFLHRPEPDEGTVDIVVAKNRSGLTGVVPLIFLGQQARLR